ncbi:aspartate/glutamate racemase family protein [Marinobacter sediminum]|uniref:maleate cis-trans isomerase family protein n=1 Tax=Marinobacter sediminum TaxID=256323 RepID=UPI00202DE6BB|nr:maleate cis-trans isomerase [Marinobacter sediminum]MCM0612874.1 aspartate/glutamate racemase family protein [Marinobacter sediminum]
MDNNGYTAHIGFLYPGHAAEDDYPQLAQMVRPVADVQVVHTDFVEDAHTVEALTEMGSPQRLIDGAGHLQHSGIEAVMWTSTSASFVRGLDGIREQIDTLEKALQVPASTTAMAFARAVSAVNAHRVAIAATYPNDVAQLFQRFLEHFDIEVVSMASHGIVTAAEVGTLGKDAVLRFARDNNHPDADALLIPDTALHSANWLEDLEVAAGKPVLTANQVSFWEGLRLCHKLTPQKGLGTLFATEL